MACPDLGRHGPVSFGFPFQGRVAQDGGQPVEGVPDLHVGSKVIATPHRAVAGVARGVKRLALGAETLQFIRDTAKARDHLGALEELRVSGSLQIASSNHEGRDQDGDRVVGLSTRRTGTVERKQQNLAAQLGAHLHHAHGGGLDVDAPDRAVSVGGRPLPVGQQVAASIGLQAVEVVQNAADPGLAAELGLRAAFGGAHGELTQTCPPEPRAAVEPFQRGAEVQLIEHGHDLRR